MNDAQPKPREMCELEGPYECPSCGGHAMFDSTYLDQVKTVVHCPYCVEPMAILESKEERNEQVAEKEKKSKGKWRGNVFVNDAGEPTGTCRGY
jgi:hypothetical protein